MGTKTISKPGDYDFYISKGAGDMVYQMSDLKTAKQTWIDFYFKGDDIDDYYFARSGDDLVIFTSFYNGTGYKYTATTVKDYYKIATKDHTTYIYLNDSNVYSKATEADIAKFANGKYTDTASDSLIIGSNKNNTFNIVNASKSENIWDVAGNDTYNVKAKYDSDKSNYIEIYDYAGNDKYSITNGAYMDKIEDYSGNDVYKVSRAEDSDVTDYKGNDTYYLSRAKDADIEDKEGNDKYTVSDSSTWIDDDKGNDTYNVSNSYIDSDDYEGNDKYTLNYTDGSVEDYAGNDTYNITLADELSVYDGEDYAGNDKYNVNGGTDLYISEYGGKDTYTINDISGLAINESGGNDTYKLSDVSNEGFGSSYGISESSGDDKYELNYVDNFSVNDYDGKDSYTITGSDYLNISDTYGNDSYKATSSYATTISDNYGDDKYQIEDSSLVGITDKSGNDSYTMTDVNNGNSLAYAVVDSEGDDKYTITSSSLGMGIMDSAGDDKYIINDPGYVIITDAGSTNDTYTVDKLTGKVFISDSNGENDKLTISGLSANNTVLMANFTTAGGSKVGNGNLYVLDANQTGFVRIANYFYTNSGTLYPDWEGVGEIENIYAGKKNLATAIDDFRDEANYLSNQVAGWLSNNTEYSSVDQLMSVGTSDEISSFILAASDWQGGGVYM